jgi:hypothetical protein
MSAEVDAVVSILCLITSRRRKYFWSLLIGQSKRVERISEEILVAITEETVHVGIGYHVICQMQDSKVQTIIASFIKDDLSCEVAV